VLFTLENIIIAQSTVRRYFAIRVLKSHRAAKKIQCIWRGYDCRVMYQEEYAARKIQTLWRGFDCHEMYQDEVLTRHDSAKIIQKNWRAFFQYSNYLILQYETQAAINIQRYWRGFLDFSH